MEKPVVPSNDSFIAQTTNATSSAPWVASPITEFFSMIVATVDKALQILK